MLATKVAAKEKQSTHPKPENTKPTVEEAAPQIQLNPHWSSLATHVGGQSAAGASGDPSPVQTKSSRSVNVPDVQRMGAEYEEEAASESEMQVQTKLTVGAPDDPYEKEADAVADKVMRMPADGEQEILQEDAPSIQSKSFAVSPIQRLCAECTEELSGGDTPSVQRKSDKSYRLPKVSNLVSQVVNSPSGGSPLNETVRSRVEPVLRSDLSHVRIHNNSQAQNASQSIQAKAFTNGNNVFLGKGQSASDIQLMAHELTHVVQQDGSGTLRRVDDEDEEVDTGRADAKATEIYDALNWLNNNQRALSALEGHGSRMRKTIRSSFNREYNQSLRSYLSSQLGGDDLVRAFALLHASNYQGQHVSMGLSLIPFQTRDEEVFRLLYGTNLGGRQSLERNYDTSFGRSGNGDEFIGEGSLKEDLIDDLSGWREQKSLALLNRDLTEADELYFDSVGINGTHEDRVVSRFQRLWDQGPQALETLKTDWNSYIRNENNWSDEQWSTQTVRDAMDGELSGEEWELVLAILDGMDRFQAEVSVPVGPLSEDESTGVEDIRLQVAEDTLDAATTGGITGWGTNDTQVYRAVRQIREIYQVRIDRARAVGNESELTQAQAAWETRRQSLVNTEIPSEMNEGSAEYIHARLLLRGNLTRADELYLADLDFDNEKIVSLVNKTWAAGGIEQLYRDAGQPVMDGSTQLRPSFRPSFLIPITRGHTASRAILLLRQDYTNQKRGSERLRLEINRTSSASALDSIKAFLTTPGLSNSLRNEVISSYVLDYVEGNEGSVNERFISYLRSRYGDEPALYDLQDVVDPVTTAAQAFGRASARYDSAHSGVLDAVLSDLVSDYDAITGEDTQAVTQESLERLRYLSEQADASFPEIQAMMQMAGVTSLNALAASEYRLFNQRLNELRSVKRAITEAIATAVQLAIETVATIITGGAAAPMLLASLGATLAAIVVREALLGDEYRAVSEENARAIAMVLVSHGAGVMGRNLFAVSPERLRELSRIQVFLLEGAQNATAQIGIQTVEAAINNRAPTSEAILASAISILGSSAGGGLQGSLSHNMAGEIGSARRLRQMMIANMAGSVVTANSEEAANMVRTGVDDFSGPGIATRLLQSTGRGMVNGVSGAAGQFGAEVRFTPRTRNDELDEGAHDPRRLPAEGEVDVDAATNREPGVIAAAPVNDAHAVSVVRDAAGNLVTTLCSPFCGHLRLMLSALREDVGSGNDSAQGSIARSLSRVDEIERRLQTNPLDPEARAALRDLGQQVASLLRTYGDERIFGPVPTVGAQPLIVIPGGESVADISRRRVGLVSDNRYAPGSDTDRQWLRNNPPPRPSQLPPDQEGMWNAYRDYYNRRLQNGSTDAPPRTWQSYRDLQSARLGHLQRGTEFEGRVSIEAEAINGDVDLVAASQTNLSQTENPTRAAGQLTRPDQLMIDPADSTGMAVSNKSRTFDDPAEARQQVIDDVNELLDSYSGDRFIRRPELVEQSGNDQGRININEVVLVYDAGAMGTRRVDETERAYSARISELAREIANTARRHAHTRNPNIVFWVTFHDYSGNSPLPVSNDPTVRVEE